MINKILSFNRHFYFLLIFSFFGCKDESSISSYKRNDKAVEKLQLTLNGINDDLKTSKERVQAFMNEYASSDYITLNIKKSLDDINLEINAIEDEREKISDELNRGINTENSKIESLLNRTKIISKEIKNLFPEMRMLVLDQYDEISSKFKSVESKIFYNYLNEENKQLVDGERNKFKEELNENNPNDSGINFDNMVLLNARLKELEIFELRIEILDFIKKTRDRFNEAKDKRIDYKITDSAKDLELNKKEINIEESITFLSSKLESQDFYLINDSSGFFEHPADINAGEVNLNNMLAEYQKELNDFLKNKQEQSLKEIGEGIKNAVSKFLTLPTHKFRFPDSDLEGVD